MSDSSPSPTLVMHQGFMARALALAARAAGQTSPNPMVGAVIVRDGEIIGEGWHHRAGAAHAEIEAIRAASGPLIGATIYVTLEPCCHFGRTPPCSQALINAGFGEVHYAIRDPNPKVMGGGHRQLESAGIRVHQGLLEAKARELNRAFFHFIQTGTPFVISKFAMSLDGRIATHTGASQWITGTEARQAGMQLRNQTDAILVGSGTILADNPRLTTRLSESEGHSPIRVVLDSRQGLPLTANVFDPTLPSSTILFTARKMDQTQQNTLRERGVEVHCLEPNRAGLIPPAAVLRELGRRNIVSLIIEGGSSIHGSFFESRLVQEVWAFIAPKIIGGQRAPGPIGGLGIKAMTDARQWQWVSQTTLGPDILLRARPRAAKITEDGSSIY